MRIRRAKIDDFLPIAALDRCAWRDYPSGAHVPDGEHVWRLWVEHTLVYCAVEKGRIVGAADAFPCADGRWFLHKIFVARSHRGRGIASRMMAAILAALDRKGVDVLLTVDPANEAALRLYENWGFTQRRLVKGYYRTSEDRFVIERKRR